MRVPLWNSSPQTARATVSKLLATLSDKLCVNVTLFRANLLQLVQDLPAMKHYTWIPLGCETLSQVTSLSGGGVVECCRWFCSSVAIILNQNLSHSSWFAEFQGPGSQCSSSLTPNKHREGDGATMTRHLERTDPGQKGTVLRVRKSAFKEAPRMDLPWPSSRQQALG